MKKRIISLILGAVLSVSAPLGAFAEAVSAEQTAYVTQESGASAAVWNGKTALKSGKSYIVNSDITISKAMVIPSKTTVTVKSGAKLWISSAGSLTVKGTLKVQSGATVAVTGKLALSVGKVISNSGTIRFGTKSTAVINGKLSINKAGVVSGKPKSLSLGNKAVITVKGKNECAKLVSAVEKRDITAVFEEMYSAALVDKDFAKSASTVYPDEYVKTADAYLKTQGSSWSEQCKEFNKQLQSEVAVETSAKITSVSVLVSSMKDITKTVGSADKAVLDAVYGKYDKVYDISAALTVNKDNDGGKISAMAVLSGGKWYVMPHST